MPGKGVANLRSSEGFEQSFEQKSSRQLKTVICAGPDSRIGADGSASASLSLVVVELRRSLIKA